MLSKSLVSRMRRLMHIEGCSRSMSFMGKTRHAFQADSVPCKTFRAASGHQKVCQLHDGDLTRAALPCCRPQAVLQPEGPSSCSWQLEPRLPTRILQSQVRQRRTPGLGGL